MCNSPLQNKLLIENAQIDVAPAEPDVGSLGCAGAAVGDAADVVVGGDDGELQQQPQRLVDNEQVQLELDSNSSSSNDQRDDLLSNRSSRLNIGPLYK